MSLDQSEYTESTAPVTAATAGAQASSGAVESEATVAAEPEAAMPGTSIVTIIFSVVNVILSPDAKEPEAAMRPEAASAGEPVGAEARPEPEPVEEALGAGAEEPAPGNPGLSIATIIFGVVGVILALWVSWILSVIAGIVAIVLGRMASRQNAPYPRAILAGKVLGVICIFANAFMVFTYVAYLMSLGVF